MKVDSVSESPWLPSAGRSLAGRAYLVAKLRERDLSKREAVRILNVILAEMKKSLQEGWAVEFPFGSLKRMRQPSKEWWKIDDGPLKPYTVEWVVDEAGDRLLNGKQPPQSTPKSVT